MGDGVNVAARWEGVAEPNGICVSGAAYEQVRDKLLRSNSSILARGTLRTSRGRCGSMPSSVLARNALRPRRPPLPQAEHGKDRRAFQSSSCRSQILAATQAMNISSTASLRA